MFDTASGWLITSLDANPIIVSLVQVAVSLPLFLFTLPAGALADVIDSRRLLIAVELAILAVSVIFAGLVSLDLATPALLLATTFLLGVGGALTSPAWGSTIPLLVPRAGSGQRDGLERRRLQYRARRWAGARRPYHRGAGNRGSFLDLRGQQCGDHCGFDLVAEAAKSRRKLACRASGQRGSRGGSPCREQSLFGRDIDLRACVLSFRQRLFGAAAAPGAPSNIAGAATLRHSSRCNRGRLRRGIAGVEMAEGRARVRTGSLRRDLSALHSPSFCSGSRKSPSRRYARASSAARHGPWC